MKRMNIHDESKTGADEQILMAIIDRTNIKPCSKTMSALRDTYDAVAIDFLLEKKELCYFFREALQLGKQGDIVLEYAV